MLPYFVRLEMITGLVVISYSSTMMTGMVRKQRKGDLPSFVDIDRRRAAFRIWALEKFLPSTADFLALSCNAIKDSFLEIPAPLSQSKQRIENRKCHTSTNAVALSTKRASTCPPAPAPHPSQSKPHNPPFSRQRKPTSSANAAKMSPTTRQNSLPA